MESVWPFSKLSIESVGSRRELVANSCTLYTPPTPTRRDATKQFRRVGVGGVYIGLVKSQVGRQQSIPAAFN